MPSLVTNVKVGETIRVTGPGSTRITLVAKSGRTARVVIARDESVTISLPERKDSDKQNSLGEC